MTTSAELLAEPVRLGGNLDRLPTDLEQPTQLVDAGRSCDRVSQEVTGHEQLAGEGVRFAFDLPTRSVCRVQEVVTEFVGDREALPAERLGSDHLDARVDQTGAQAAEAVDLDDVETDPASDRRNGNRRLRDVVLGEHPPGHVAGMGRMSLLIADRTTGDSEQLLRPLILLQVDGHSRGSALWALILEAGRRREANPAFLLGAAQIRHDQTETDYRPLHVPLTEGRRNPTTAVISLCCRRFGDARTVEGATMDKKERKVFAEVDRLRGDEGLGEKLDRYRQSRDQYERLFKGHKESGPSLPLQRPASARGRVRGIFGRND